MSASRASGGTGTGSRWTRAEDTALVRAVEVQGSSNWDAVCREPGLAKRTPDQCRRRYETVLSAGLVKGPWMPQEDQVILDCVARGITRWSEIAEHIPGRIGKQCRERWQNHLCPDLNRGPFTAEEDAILEAAVAELGTRWIEVARRLPGRSENACKNRYNSSRRRRANAEARASPGGRSSGARASTSDDDEDEGDDDEDGSDGEGAAGSPLRGSAARAGDGDAAAPPSADARRHRHEGGAEAATTSARRAHSLTSTPSRRPRSAGKAGASGVSSSAMGRLLRKPLSRVSSADGLAASGGSSPVEGDGEGSGGGGFRGAASRLGRSSAGPEVLRVTGSSEWVADGPYGRPRRRRRGEGEGSSYGGAGSGGPSAAGNHDDGDDGADTDALAGTAAGNSSASVAATLAAAVLMSTSGGPASSPTSAGAAAGGSSYTYDIDLGAINDDLETMEDEDGHVHDMLEGSVRGGRGMGGGGATLLALRPGMADGHRSAGFVQAGSLRRHESMDETMAVAMEVADWGSSQALAQQARLLGGGAGASSASPSQMEAAAAAAAASGAQSMGPDSLSSSSRRLLVLNVADVEGSTHGGRISRLGDSSARVPSPLPSLDRVYAATLLSSSSATGIAKSDTEVSAAAEAFAVSRVSPVYWRFEGSSARVSPAKRRHEEEEGLQHPTAEDAAAAEADDASAVASPAPRTKRPRLSSPSLTAGEGIGAGSGDNGAAAAPAVVMTPAPVGLPLSASEAPLVPPGATATRDGVAVARALPAPASASAAAPASAAAAALLRGIPGGSAPGTTQRSLPQQGPSSVRPSHASLDSVFSPARGGIGEAGRARVPPPPPALLNDSAMADHNDDEEEEDDEDAGSDHELSGRRSLGRPGSSNAAIAAAVSASRCGSASSYRARCAALAAAAANGGGGGRASMCGATSAHLEYPSFTTEAEGDDGSGEAAEEGQQQPPPPTFVRPPGRLRVPAAVAAAEEDGADVWHSGANDAAAVPSVLPSPIPLPAAAMPAPTSVQPGAGVTFAFRIAPASPQAPAAAAAVLPSPRAVSGSGVGASAFTPATPVLLPGGVLASKGGAGAPLLSLHAIEGGPPVVALGGEEGPLRARSGSTGSVSSVLLRLATGPGPEAPSAAPAAADAAGEQ